MVKRWGCLWWTLWSLCVTLSFLCLPAERTVPHGLFTPLLIGSVSAAGILCLVLIMLFYKYMQVDKYMRGRACRKPITSFVKKAKQKNTIFFVFPFVTETQIPDSVESYRGHPWKQLRVHWPDPTPVRSSVGVSSEQLAVRWAPLSLFVKVISAVSMIPFIHHYWHNKHPGCHVLL